MKNFMQHPLYISLSKFQTSRINRNIILIFCVDLVLITLSLYFAYLIRFDYQILSADWLLYKQILPTVILIKMTTFYWFNLYIGIFRFTGISDLSNILKASTISSLLILVYILFNNRFEGFSRSVFTIDYFITIVLLSGSRVLIRIYYEKKTGNKEFIPSLISKLKILNFEKKKDVKNLLIIGAGSCGNTIFREIKNNSTLKYKIIGFADDNPLKQGMTIQGHPVLGSIKNIHTFVEKYNIDELLIAIPSATSKQIRVIINHCNNAKIKFKTIPGYGELINGKVTINSIRNVAYNDLLGRDTVKLDQKKIGNYIKDNTIMVTGAGGSIGSELCRQICRFSPKKLLLFERAESPLYEIELELKHDFSNIEIVPVLEDIQKQLHLDAVFEKNDIDIVFHAAAYKHVPMLEIQPWKAVQNNIAGTQNLIEISKKYKVKRFVFVSTDKAVRPTNVMGASKRIAEMLIQSQDFYHKSTTKFMIVRFGNVAGSVGSVIPLFKKQIKHGGPITVTHPDVTRYFMLVHEACQLILQAGAISNGSSGAKIFILDMGTPIKIDDMAKDLIQLSGLQTDIDIKIKYVGLRPGEKLYEELITEGEGIVKTDHEKIMILEGKYKNPVKLNGNIKELISQATIGNSNVIRDMLKDIVPEYSPANLN